MSGKRAEEGGAPEGGVPPPRLLLGLGLMTLAMLTIPLVDGLAKYLSSGHSPFYIAWARYAVAAALVLPLALALRGRRALPRRNLGPHVLRTLFLMGAMTCYFVAIAEIPLATAISAYFVGPIVGTVLAVLLLGERLTVRKGAAVVLGFAGALLIVRPGGDIEPGILLALAAGCLFACYMIATRLASQSADPIQTLAFQCLVGALILTPQALATWSVPLPGELWLFALLGLFSVTSHILSITAFRYADASTLAPLVYLELVGSAAVGFLVFDELPDLLVWIGAGVIVASGMLLIRREPR
jgi:drug/metabolite transporter (DMT)-like permease